MRSYDRDIFASHGLVTDWQQENQSLSRTAYTIRGLHFQAPPAAETKLVRAIQGRIFDVMVDLRVNSQSFGQWYGIELSEENHLSLYIPKGCAHGFCTLEEGSIIAYKVDHAYTPDREGCLHYADADLGISWPIPEGVVPLLSEKDEKGQAWRGFTSPFK